MTSYFTAELPNPAIRVCCSEVEMTAGNVEYNIVLTCAENRPFAEVYAQMIDLLNEFRRTRNAVPVFGRVFLSDPSNQRVSYTELGFPLSIIGQSPLEPYAKAAMWVTLRKDASITIDDDNFYIISDSRGHKEYWVTGRHALHVSSFKATEYVMELYSAQLEKHGTTLADGCMRTWFFVRDIDNNYKGMVEARNKVFDEQGLTPETHFIASTGIGGSLAFPSALVAMDAVAYPDVPKEDIHYLKAATHLNPTHEYGVAFERATAVDCHGMRRIFISGTASINNKGEIVAPGNIEAQTLRMCQNVEALLAEGACTAENLTHSIVYVRDIADAATVKSIIANRYPGLPFVVVLAPVCRTGWLVEMECQALRPLSNAD